MSRGGGVASSAVTNAHAGVVGGGVMPSDESLENSLAMRLQVPSPLLPRSASSLESIIAFYEPLFFCFLLCLPLLYAALQPTKTFHHFLLFLLKHAQNPLLVPIPQAFQPPNEIFVFFLFIFVHIVLIPTYTYLFVGPLRWTNLIRPQFAIIMGCTIEYYRTYLS
jgi:hypothetical protein